MTKFEERTEFFTREDVIDDSEFEHYVGKIVVMSSKRVKKFHEQYQTPQNQLYIANSGFGCNPLASGTAVFATCIGDGDHARWDRGDFIGILKDELVKELELDVHLKQLGIDAYVK